MSIEVSSDYTSTAVSCMMMLNALTQIVEDIVSRVEMSPLMRVIDVSCEFTPERSSFSV